MEAKFWQQRWQEDKIGFHLSGINPWLKKYLNEFKLVPKARIFVPLCGKSQDLIYLAERGFGVVGVELIKQAIDDFFAEQKLSPNIKTMGKFTQYSANNISILHGDYFALDNSLIGKIDLVFDRASMIAMPQDMRKDYPKQMKNIIGNCQQILLITIEYPQNKLSGPPFSVTKTEIKNAYQNQFSINLLEEDDITTESTFAELDYATEKIWQLKAN